MNVTADPLWALVPADSDRHVAILRGLHSQCEIEGSDDAVAALDAAIAALSQAGVVGFPWENFPSFLIDKCEGDTITEERLQRAAADMLNDAKYMKAAAPAVAVDEAAAVDLSEVLSAFDKAASIAQRNAGTVDAVEERGGEDADDPMEAIHFILHGAYQAWKRTYGRQPVTDLAAALGKEKNNAR